jgi:hypothetical protein
MGQRILLVDSDIFVLLAGAGVLERVADLLGFDLKDLRRLDALPHQLRKSAKFRKKYSPGVIEKALAYCGKVSSLLERPKGDDILQRLAEADCIDEGEAVMLGLMAEQEIYLLASGDKVAMRALAQSPALAEVKKAVSGRIICLESVIRLLIGKLGPGQTAAAFAPLLDSNGTLRIAFSQGEQTTEAHCLEAIESYLKDLQKDVGNGFLLIPEVPRNDPPEKTE